jgi:hypothetical protein
VADNRREIDDRGKARRAERTGGFSSTRLDELIEQATVDAYGGDEQRTAFLTMIEDEVAFPFGIRVFGVEATVERVDQNEAGDIVAICSWEGERQPIAIVDLPLPHPPPKGAEWIAAYRRWARNMY